MRGNSGFRIAFMLSFVLVLAMAAARACSVDSTCDVGGSLLQTRMGRTSGANEDVDTMAGELADESYGRSVAFAGVFGFGADPQRPQTYQQDTDAHYSVWAHSIETLGMQGVVLHDPSVFSDDFVVNASTAHLHFHTVNLTAGGLYTDPARMKLTPPDWRFIALHDYLAEHPGRHDYVLLTDATDVVFRRDPLAYMKAVDEANAYHFLYGQEEWHPWAPMFTEKELAERNQTMAKDENSAFGRLGGYWKSCFGHDMPPDTQFGRMTNCGILGGHVSVVRPFLEKMLVHYASVPIENRFMMCDMLVFLKTVTEDYNDRFVSGYPFHSKFKHSDPYENAIIYHKSEIPSKGRIPHANLLDELPSNFTNTLAHNN